MDDISVGRFLQGAGHFVPVEGKAASMMAASRPLLYSLWCSIKLNHGIEYGQPFSGNLANPFVVDFEYLF